MDDFLRAAIDATVSLRPREYGLTADELHEVASQAGFLAGEVQDAIVKLRRGAGYGGSRLLPEPDPAGARGLSADFNFECVPDYRKVEAFEFVRVHLQELARRVGEASARLTRDIFVEHGVAAGLTRDEVEVAISIHLLDKIFDEKNGTVGHAPHQLTHILPSRQIASRGNRDHRVNRQQLAKAYPLVRDVIERRTDGRAPRANALDAFETALANLGQDRFRTWWIQKRQELRLQDPIVEPTCVLVLGASLAEAALAFLIPRAQKEGLMKRIDLAKPRTWKFADLVGGSKSGDPSVDPILDERLAQRALDLNEARQRVHAGYLVDTVPTGNIPDLKPEQAASALHAVEAIVRAVLEWIERHP